MADKKQFIRDTYEQFFKDKIFTLKKAECNSVLNEWKKWREKIIDSSLPLDEYVNRRCNKKDYLIYFLNNIASVYGRSREGSANYWMVKLNDGGESYYTAEYVNSVSQKISENKNATRDEAEKLYFEKVLPLLKATISKNGSIEELVEFCHTDEYKWFRCEQMLEKMMVLESVLDTCNADYKYCLPNFYKGPVIDKLYYEYFKLSGEDTRVGKSYQIMRKCYELLDIDKNNRNAATQFEISSMLWDLATYNSFDVTEDAPNVIFYGSPGTGKTYTVKKMIQYLTRGNSNQAVFIQCHPGFGYEDFMEGLKPVGYTANGSIKFEVVNGVFKDLCIKAKKDPGNVYYFVADEINRANLSSMFGETLSLLESDYRDNGTSENLRKTALSKLIEAQIADADISVDKINCIAYDYDAKEGVFFGVPKNIRFIGMMNDVDKSIDSFDLALRRRFKWIRKDCDYEVIADQLSAHCDEDEIERYIDKCKQLNRFISKKDEKGLGFGKAYEFGHAYFLKIKSRGTSITKSACETLFEEHLKPVLTEYIRSFRDDDEIDKVLKTAREIFTK